MDRITILLCLLGASHVLCSPSTKLDSNSSSVVGNVHDKRSIGSLLMPLLSGITSDSGAGGGVLSLLGSLLTNQLAGGGGGGGGSRGAGNNRPIQDHYGAASSGGGRSMSAGITSHRGPGLAFNLDLGRIGSNLISGFNAGRQFGNTGGALLGSFLQAGIPSQQQQQQRPFQENQFSNGGGGGFDNQQGYRGSGSPPFRQGNSLLPPPPQSFQDELPRDFHSRGRPNMSPAAAFPPSQQQIDLPINPSSSAPPLNEFNMPQQQYLNFESALPQPHSMAQQPQQQQQFGNQEQQQQQVEQPPRFEENVSSGETMSDNNEKRKPGQRSRKRKPTKSQVQIISNSQEQFPDSTGNRELSVPQNNNNNQNSQVINDQGSDPNFYNRPSPFSDSSFNPQQQLQHQQQFQAAPPNSHLQSDNSAFASNNFPTQMQQFAPNQMGASLSQQDSARGLNYAHSVPLAFDQYGERFPGNGGEVWLTDEDEASDDASF